MVCMGGRVGIKINQRTLGKKCQFFLSHTRMDLFRGIDLDQKLTEWQQIQKEKVDRKMMTLFWLWTFHETVDLLLMHAL